MESLAAIYITKLLDTTKPATSSLKFSMFCTIQRIENEVTDWNLKLKAAGFVEGRFYKLACDVFAAIVP